MKFYFYFCVFMIIYVYVGYPILTGIFSLLLKKKIKTKDSFTPKVTIIIAAYNEEVVIENTLRNKYELDYPAEQLQLIVVSDESTDATDEIVSKFTDKGLKFFRQEPRAGKTSALNMAVPHANGEIIVFSDANSFYQKDALKKLVRNFSDPDVGYVTGKMIYTNPDGSTIGDGCSAYMKYENFLRKFETRIGSVVGVDGGIDAMRKKLYSRLNADQLPDFVQPLKVIEQGYRVVYEPQALLKESSLSTSEDEYRMRVRVSLRALWALKDMNQLLIGKAGFLFAWQLWSHKLIRYLCFIFLMGAYVANLFLWPEMFFYKFSFIVQTIFYAGAFSSSFLKRKKHQIKLFYFFYYFVLLNVAAGHAFFKFMIRKKQIIWTPRKG